MPTRTEGFSGEESGATHSGTGRPPMSRHESGPSNTKSWMKKYAELLDIPTVIDNNGRTRMSRCRATRYLTKNVKPLYSAETKE